ncbi:MAG: hypothetical protein EXR06_00595 [Rickettsiales bacterium]|nr:hypothetical protein [Rickettsiales bacterium]
MIDFLLLHKISPLLIIIAGIFLFIIFARILLSLFIAVAQAIYGGSIKTAEFIKNDLKKFIKEDEELLRKLDEIPKAHSAVRADKIGKLAPKQDYELITSEQQQKEKAELAETKIVDIVKPIGFWTSVILGQKLTYLIQSAQIINKRANRGFWVSMVEAQEQAAGKQHGRTR